MLSLGQDKRTGKRDQEREEESSSAQVSVLPSTWLLVSDSAPGGRRDRGDLFYVHTRTHVAHTIGCDVQLLTGRRHMFVFLIYIYRYMYGAHTCCWVLIGQRRQQGVVVM